MNQLLINLKLQCIVILNIDLVENKIPFDQYLNVIKKKKYFRSWIMRLKVSIKMLNWIGNPKLPFVLMRSSYYSLEPCPISCDRLSEPVMWLKRDRNSFCCSCLSNAASTKKNCNKIVKFRDLLETQESPKILFNIFLIYQGIAIYFRINL